MRHLTLAGLATVIAVGALGVGVTDAEARSDQRHGPRINFEEVDLNADGLITAEELQAHRTTRFETNDQNDDGFLSKDEMLAAVAKRMAKRAAERVERIFERRDDDVDGQISFAEAGGNRDASRLVERLDSNGDGAISEEELNQIQNRRNGTKPDDDASGDVQ